MNVFKKAGLALLATFGLSSAALAVPGYVTTDLNLRAGPSTAYPVVITMYAGEPVEIHGCLSGYSWCDISYDGYRGWASSRYLQTIYGGRRVILVEAPPPIITFSFGTYWDSYYRDRSFYRYRDRYDRREFRQDRRERRQDAREQRRERRQDVRQDRRERRQEVRQERRERRQEARQERRRETVQERRQQRRQEARQERRQERRADRRQERRVEQRQERRQERLQQRRQDCPRGAVCN